MARQICRLDGRKISQNRSAHLRNAHGIDSRYKGAVETYYVRPEDVGLTQEEFEKKTEGEVVIDVSKL